MGQRLLSADSFFSIRSPFFYINVQSLNQRLPFQNTDHTLLELRQWLLLTIVFLGELFCEQDRAPLFRCRLRQKQENQNTN